MKSNFNEIAQNQKDLKYEKKSSEVLVAKSCFGHLDGKLGTLLFKRMIELKYFKPKVGKTNTYGIRERYEITKKGYQELANIGIDLSNHEEIAKR